MDQGCRRSVSSIDRKEIIAPLANRIDTLRLPAAEPYPPLRPVTAVFKAEPEDDRDQGEKIAGHFLHPGQCHESSLVAMSIKYHFPFLSMAKSTLQIPPQEADAFIAIS